MFNASVFLTAKADYNPPQMSFLHGYEVVIGYLAKLFVSRNFTAVALAVAALAIAAASVAALAIAVASVTAIAAATALPLPPRNVAHGPAAAVLAVRALILACAAALAATAVRNHRHGGLASLDIRLYGLRI